MNKQQTQDSPGKTGKVHFEVKQPTIVELALLVETFSFDPLGEKTFGDWYGRHKQVFKTQAAHLGDAGKVELMLLSIEVGHTDKQVVSGASVGGGIHC